jgi:hypothetical protein
MGPYEEKYTLFSDDEPTGWVDLNAGGDAAPGSETAHESSRWDSDEGWGPSYSDVTE